MGSASNEADEVYSVWEFIYERLRCLLRSLGSGELSGFIRLKYAFLGTYLSTLSLIETGLNFEPLTLRISSIWF